MITPVFLEKKNEQTRRAWPCQQRFPGEVPLRKTVMAHRVYVDKKTAGESLETHLPFLMQSEKNQGSITGV
jgi:hypothetical protein